ncbi:hypothetical protein K505DRAFT_362040 [Melanomma pulvis-pyrius CBS 109.77]|uniref:Zn(2)-C6 fungal-type domain-containing protein n=1 Tax=Melanomma pulvis-pyrius CBS 109.77 TaxID=1314802 RepID=A0A6A6XAE6_9PLEO|nr:hypothetical protein K505DRAFT_362040 [Melanomma pulvis-pyrius CBS 109.77]
MAKQKRQRLKDKSLSKDGPLVDDEVVKQLHEVKGMCKDPVVELATKIFGFDKTEYIDRLAPGEPVDAPPRSSTAPVEPVGDPEDPSSIPTSDPRHWLDPVLKKGDKSDFQHSLLAHPPPPECFLKDLTADELLAEVFPPGSLIRKDPGFWQREYIWNDLTLGTQEEEEEAPPPPPKRRSTGLTYSKRACDNCRRNKAKCDGEDPCTRCFKKRFKCTWNAAPKERGRFGEGRDAGFHCI